MLLLRTTFVATLLGLAACGGNDGSGSSGPLVSGTVSGLAAGNQVVVSNDGADRQTLSANGSFAFPNVAAGQRFAITAVSARLDQDCTIANGSGVADASTPATVVVTCSVAQRHAFRAASSMHATRLGHRLLALPDGTALAIGGDTGAGFSGTLPDTIEKYDPPVDRWTTLASLPVHYTPVSSSLLSDGRVLIVLSGRQELGQPSPLLWMFFDPATGALTNAPAPLVAQWYGNGVTLADGRLLMVGSDAGCACMHAQVFDPSRSTWSAVADPDYQIPALVSRLPDGRIVLVGGTTHVDLGGYWGSTPTTEVQALLPNAGTWMRLTDMPAPLLATGTVLTDGRVFLIGQPYDYALNVSATQEVSDFLDPIAGIWRVGAALDPIRVDFAMATAVDGTLLFIGGNAPFVQALHTVSFFASVTDVDAFDPTRNAWSRWQPLVDARSQAVAVLLANGKVLVAGGQRQTAGTLTTTFARQPLASAELGY